MHRKNKHNTTYNFDALITANPSLKPFVFLSPLSQNQTIDFSNPDAVYQLNKAILLQDYGLKDWQLPKGYLCPPIPGRADYLHHIHDLLQSDSSIENDSAIKGLDIGVGANTIYPILAAKLYQWQMVGCDINEQAIISAQQNVSLNPSLQSFIDIRFQNNPAYIFKNIVGLDESFHFTMCNPPFFSSEDDARKASFSKTRNLNQNLGTLNFGGQANELWCNGGEALFIKRMIKQSTEIKHQVIWFTTLVSKQAHVAKLQKQLDKVKAAHKLIPMEQGHKKSRILAWKYE